MAKTYAVSERDMRGLAIRLDMLGSHYRKPKDFKAETLNSSAKTLRRWLSTCVPNDGPVPDRVLLALCDDLNTPQAIAEMHLLARTDGQGLFAAMKLLGLLPGEGLPIDYDIGEVKTLPIDHIPIVRWAGFATVGEA